MFFIFLISFFSFNFVITGQHLNRISKIGFEESFPIFEGIELEEDDDLSAWCNACEKVRITTNSWNEQSMKSANVQLVCENCYFEIKEFQLVG